MDLHRYIVPKFATRWMELGIQLEIPKYSLDAIAVNKMHHPSYSEQCCLAMLEKWIEITPNATWNILQQAIGFLPTVACNENSQSM